MSFYKVLSPYYDFIFPLNNNALSFLSTSFNKGESLLDIGAGTGSMAIALAEKGLIVTAIEPEETMAEHIGLKAVTSEVPLSIHTKSMEQIEQLQETFDGIYCIGNTLAHLQNLEDLESFLNKCFKKLKQNGRLILQLVNYDNVISNDNFSFPVIKKENFVFTRQYEKKKEHILFTTTLTTDKESKVNTVSLYPITSLQLIPLLEKAGFQEIQAYGSFKGESYSPNSQALIVVARTVDL